MENRKAIKKISHCNTEGPKPVTKNKQPIKKSIVRNTINRIPEVRITKDYLIGHNDKGVQTETTRKQSCTLKNYCTPFDNPKPYTLEKLVKNIKCPDIDEKIKCDKKLTADEKVLKNLNFPYDRPIYKNLIPLVCEKTQSPPVSHRNPLPLKDKEPNLSDFLEFKKYPDYFVLNHTQIDEKVLITRNNNLRLYKILNSYD